MPWYWCYVFRGNTGPRGGHAAWPLVTSLVASEETDKYLLLAAIDAVAGIRPREAGMILVHLTDSGDEDDECIH